MTLIPPASLTKFAANYPETPHVFQHGLRFTHVCLAREHDADRKARIAFGFFDRVETDGRHV